MMERQSGQFTMDMTSRVLAQPGFHMILAGASRVPPPLVRQGYKREPRIGVVPRKSRLFGFQSKTHLGFHLF
jgi:hypothetical protein